MLWLRKFTSENLIKRVKPKARMPHYIANHESEDYRVKKRLFALQTMANAGFLQHLAALPNAKAVILFGSMIRWDWYSESDIDLFIFGNPGKMDVGKYRKNCTGKYKHLYAKTKKN